jgi:PAS domain S-box-containing protein
MGLAVKKVSSRRRSPIRNTSPRIGTKPALSKEYQAVFENTGKAMVIVEEDATISLANAEFEKLSGYTKEEIEGTMSWTEFVARDDRKRVREYHRLRRTDPMLAPRSFAFRFLDRQEKVKNVVLTIGKIPGTNKSMASLLDITDRRQAEMSKRNGKEQEGGVKEHMVGLEKANKSLHAEVANLKRKVKKLQESEEHYRNLVEKVDFGINLIDAEHNIVMANAEQSKRMHKPVSELIGKKCFREFEKRDAVCPYCPGVQTLATGQFAEAETEAVRDDGSRFHVRIQTFPISGQDGAVTAFIEVVEDITERKQMEEQLQQSEERYRSLAENIKLGISLIDPDHNIIMINPAQSKKFKKTVNEMIGKKCYQEFENRDTVCPHCPGVQSMATGQSVEAETETVRDDGSRFHVRLQAFPILGKDGTASGFIEVCEDITKRVRTEEGFRASEERFRMLAENMPFGISVMAPDRSFEYFNPQFAAIFGYTKEDIPDKDAWFEKAYPDEAYRKEVSSLWKKDVKQDVKIGEENPRIFTVRCKNGEDKIIDFRTVYEKDGKQYLIYEDITDRAKAEEALKQSEERYRALVENVNLGINLIDADHNIMMVNAGQSSHFGKPRSETIGKKCYQEFEKRDVVCPHCPGVQTMATGQPAEAETEGIRDDGSHFNVRLQTFPIFGQDGAVTSFIEVVEDITERKQMEEELRQTENRYRTLVETMKVGLSAIDEKGVLTYTNEQHCKILGYSMDEMIGRPTTDFQDEETRKAQKEIFAKRKKGMRDLSPYEVTWVTKDGRKVNTILTPTPSFDADGHFTGSFAIITDITERKRMEEQLQRYAADLERSNEEVKNFAYIVSHDLRVPLVNLKGYTAELRSALEVISPNMATALPHLTEEKRSAVAMALHEDVPEALEFITTSVSQMDSFINSVLQLSRLGRQELKSEPIDMNALVQTTVENLSHQIQEQGIKVAVGSLPQVVADRTSMEQIMGNVLSNAVKYLDPERLGQIAVTAETNNGEQIFRIQDNGRGIAEEDMHKVFAPFRRAGKQDTPGEGMGLAYVQTLVRRHRGRIWCESELGKGTTMTFTISQHLTEGRDHVKDR